MEYVSQKSDIPCWATHSFHKSLFIQLLTPHTDVVYIQKVTQEFICKVCPLPLSHSVSGTLKWIFNWKEKMWFSSTYFLLVNFKNYLFSCTLPFFFQTFFLFPVSSQPFVHCLNQRAFGMSTPKIRKNNVKRFWAFIHCCSFPGKPVGVHRKLWDTRMPHSMSSSKSQHETSLSLHVFLLWISQIGPFTYFSPYMQARYQK